MYNPREHSSEENQINFFKTKTTKELEKELKYYLNQKWIGGFNAIQNAKELFKRRYSDTNEIEKLIQQLKISLVNYNTKERYQHYHCNEKIILIFRDRILKDANPTVEDIMCFVTCLDAFYNAGLRYEKDKSGIEKMTTFIKKNWTNNLKLFEQIKDQEVNSRNVETFISGFNLERNLYSFITKFYHQFNPNYPIYDSKLEKLLYLVFPKIKKSVYKEYTSYYNIYFYVFLSSLNERNLEMNVNDFDNAAWILIKEKEEELKKRGEKLTLTTLLN